MSIIIILILSNPVFSQKNKSIDFGISTPISYDSRIPSLALTPNFNYCIDRHQFELGLDIYGNNLKSLHKIVGPHIAYKYLLRDETKRFNVFLDVNLQFVQYGSGLLMAVPYDYLPTDTKKDFNLIQTKSLINTFGLGINVVFLKRVSFMFVIGSGYNYYKSRFAPTNVEFKEISTFPANEKANPIIYTRIGLAFKILKDY